MACAFSVNLSNKVKSTTGGEDSFLKLSRHVWRIIVLKQRRKVERRKYKHNMYIPMRDSRHTLEDHNARKERKKRGYKIIMLLDM
jgi:hypothetical protein